MPEVKAIVADVVSARKDERNLKVLSGILAVSIIVLIGSMFAAAYLASTVSKEVRRARWWELLLPARACASLGWHAG